VPPSHAFRVGIGYDSHRFEPGGPLILGGVHIAVDFSLHGHSDGDAVAHAVTDAVLGAAALGDIGEMFPDTDPANRGANSITMLQAAVSRAATAGWRPANADVTVVTESPKLAPYRDDMRVKLAEALSIDASAVSVKAKSNEGMGWVGRGEGLACIAVVLLVANSTG
jgi:2-C-methyl-D-erythritol 2,4-cyclodiphosphate synthase